MDVALAALAVFFAQLFKGVAGFGSGLVAVPLVTLLYGPREAIFLCVCADLVSSSWLVWRARSEVAPSVVLAMLVPFLGGQWVGTGWLVSWPIATVKAVLAAVVAVFALDMVVRPVKAGHGEIGSTPDDRPDVFVLGAASGLVGGVMAGLVGAGGPPVVIYTRRFFTDRFARAQLLALFLPAGAALAAMLLARGATDPSGAWRLVALIPATVAGAGLGAELSGRVPRVAFARIVGVLLVLAAVALVV